MVCIDMDEEKVSTLGITPRWFTRLLSLFGVGATYRIVIAHRGSIDKLVVYLNDEEIGLVVPHGD